MVCGDIAGALLGVLQGSRIGTGDAVGRLGLAIDAVRHYQPVAAPRNCCGSPGERQRPDGRSVPAPNVGTVPPERDRCGNDIGCLFAPDVCFARRRRTAERNRWRYPDNGRKFYIIHKCIIIVSHTADEYQ